MGRALVWHRGRTVACPAAGESDSERKEGQRYSGSSEVAVLRSRLNTLPSHREDSARPDDISRMDFGGINVFLASFLSSCQVLVDNLNLGLIQK